MNPETNTRERAGGAGGTALWMSAITKTYPGVTALMDVSFDVHKGEIHGLVGENGAGKSTLVKVLAGATRPDSGRVALDGVEVTKFHPSNASQMGLSVSYQEISLVPDASVAENLCFGALPKRLGLTSRKRLVEEARDVLDEIGVEVDPSAMVRELSIAQQQLVEIARAVRLASVLIVLDEPTAALSQHEADVLYEVVKRLSGRGVAVLYISHRLEEVLAICDRVTVLRDGRHVITTEATQIDRQKLVRHMVGRAVTDLYPSRPVKIREAEPLLKVERLRRPDLEHELDFELHSGEIVGCFGLVGAGRSEAVRVVAGVDPAFGGTVTVDGSRLTFGSTASAVALGIAFVPEDRKVEGLVLDFGVGTNLVLPSLRVFGRLWARPKAEAAHVREASDSLSVRSSGPRQRVGTLSGGNQQKIAIGKWFRGAPKVLIVDEPTRGIDIGAKAQVYDLLARLAEGGMGILMVSSELPEILGLSDRVLVFHDGRIAGELSRADATPEELLELALGGRSSAHV